MKQLLTVFITGCRWSRAKHKTDNQEGINESCRICFQFCQIQQTSFCYCCAQGQYHVRSVFIHSLQHYFASTCLENLHSIQMMWWIHKIYCTSCDIHCIFINTIPSTACYVGSSITWQGLIDCWKTIFQVNIEEKNISLVCSLSKAAVLTRRTSSKALLFNKLMLLLKQA